MSTGHENPEPIPARLQYDADLRTESTGNNLSSDEFSAAILAHQTWVARFQNTVKGIDREAQDPDLAGDDTLCQFGRWLHANPAAFTSQASYEQVISMHRAFHMTAGKIAAMLQEYQPGGTMDAEMSLLRDQSRQLATVLLAEKLAHEEKPD